jgi:hypothetical protein
MKKVPYMKKTLAGLLLGAIILALSSCDLTGVTKLTCSFMIKPDQYEPNNKPEEATPLSSSAELTGTFVTGDKPDYFTVTGSTGDTITLEKKAGLGNPVLNVTDAQGNKLVVKDELGVSTLLTATLPKTGTYLISAGITPAGTECPEIEYDVSIIPAPASVVEGVLETATIPEYYKK